MKDKFLSKAYGGVTEARRKLYGLGLPRQWKVITSTLLLLFTFAIGNVWGQTLIEVDDMETTSGSGTSFAVSGFKKNDCDAVSQSSEARTGSYSLKTTLNGTGDKSAKTVNASISVAKNSYLHCVGWAKMESSDATAEGTGNQATGNSYVGGNGKGTYVNLKANEWIQFTSNKKASSNQSSCYVLLQRKHSAKKAVLFDDVVIYVSTNATTDITAPDPATSASATTSSISWTNGSDANTGIQNTLIWKRTGGSANDLTLNNQGKYEVPATGSTLDQSGHWTLVTASVAADAETYDGTFVAGDVYAIVHRDLAYNYSEPVYTTIIASCTKPGTPGIPSVSSKTHNTANLTWTAAGNSDGYKVSIVKKSDASVIVDWTTCATNSYTATGLAAETEYTFKVKAIGASGYCELGDEATVDVTTNAAPAACPSGLTISGTAAYTEGENISLTAALSEGNGEITYTWYKGADLATAKAAGSIGTGTSFSKASCTTGDAGNYFCVATKDACSDAESTAYAVTVAAVTACYTFTPTLPAEPVTFAVNDIVPGSTGGSIKVLGNTMKNTAYGLSFESNSSAKVEVTLGSLMKIGTQISVTILADYKENNNRGLLLQNGEGTKKADWVWKPAVDAIREAHNFSYTVQEGDGMVGTNVFRIARSTNAIITSLTVSNCGADLLELSSAIDPVHDPAYATVTLSKTLLAAGGTATATYSAIDPAYDFDEWQISGTGATLSSTTANPTTITMGSTDAVVTLKLKAASVKHTVTYYDGVATPENKLGEELIEHNGNPTGAGLAPKKHGYTFGGWSTTNGGAAVAYGDVTVNEDKNLFAVWTPVVCPTSGVIFSAIADPVKAPGSDYQIAGNTRADLATYATISGGSAVFGNADANQYITIKSSTSKIALSGSNMRGYVKVTMDCDLEEGDIIRIADNSNKFRLAFDSTGTVKNDVSSGNHDVLIDADRKGKYEFFIYRNGNDVNFGSIQVLRPYTVSFNLNGQSATAIEDQKIAAGGKVTKPDDPVVTGQAFGGWYKVAACTAGNEWDFANDVVNDDVELFAKWTALKSMTLNAGEGTGDPIVSYPTVGDPVVVPACPVTFEKSGYIFAGWVYSHDVTVEGGQFTMPDANLTLTAQWIDASSVARIGSTYYGTFADAIAAVADGQTIQLLQNCAFASAWTIEGKTVTLDMNGKNLTGPATGDAIDINTDGKLILKDDAATEDPTINGSNEVTYAGGKLTGKWPINVNAGGEFVMNGGWIVANEAAAWVGYTGKVTINNGVLEAMDNAVVMAPGNAGKGGYTIDINGGILLGHIASAGYASACVYHPNTGVLNISGGTLVSTDGPAVVVRCGESHITGGTIISQGDGGKVGDASAVVPAVGVVYDFKANYPGDDINAAITAGNITSVAAIYDGATPTTAEINAVNISGGTFSSPVAEALCAPSYVPETKANGKYGVIVPAQSIDFMAIIEAEGTGDEGKAELDAQLSSKHYDIDGTLNNDRLEAGGFKVKKTGLTISFSVEKEKVVEITTGHISGASIKVDDAAAVAMEGDKKHTYYSDDAQAFLITMTATGNAYNIFKSINIRDPYEVTFEAHGDADPAALQGKPSVILPSATNGTKSLTGWFTEETGGTKIGDATDEYTPTANITLHAQWEDISTDARLASIEFSASGTLSPAFDPEVVNYTYTMPYGTADVPTITGATKANPAAKDPVIDAQAAAWGETAHVHGVAASDDTKDYYVQMLRAPKDGICIIKSTPTSGTEAAVDGIYQGSAYFKGNAKKLKNEYDYVGVELAAGYTFQAGDKVVLNQTAAVSGTDITKFYIFTEVPASGKTYVTVDNAVPVQGNNWFDMPAELVGRSALYIGRINNAYCNPTVGYLAVYRPLPPVLNKVTVNGVEGKPNALKQIEIEVPFSTSQSQLEAIAYDWVSNNDAWTADPANAPVATNAWAFSVANTVTLTDKDGDESVYTITVNKATASTSVELATLTVDGNAITLVPGQAVYSYEYPYGTAETPAPEVAATAADNAEVGTITQAATKNGTATFTVTAEDGITYRDYTINISVSRVPAVAIYDGSTMTNITTKTGSDPTGLSWSMGSNVAATGDNIAGTWQGKNYTHAVKGFKANANANNLVSFVVPEDYMAKVRLVGSTNSSGSERKMFIAKEATNDASKAIENYVITSSTYDAQGFVTDFMLPGTYYLGSTDSYRLFEFSVQLYPIDYSRATTEGRYGTICLPNGGIMVGATLYEVAYYGATSEKIFFDEILNGTMVAGVPYIYLPNEGADKLAVFYTDEANESAKSANGLVGYIGASENTSDALPVPHNDGNYILNNNQYREVVSANSAYILSHRAYIHLAGITPSEPALAPGRRRISMSVYSEQVATGIENTGFESEAPRKVLINGELFIIRGEKMYDAKGQLVK